MQQQHRQANTQDNSSSTGRTAAPPDTSASASSSSSSGASSGSELAALASAGSKSVAVVSEFRVDAARQLLEAEIKDTFLGTAGAAAGELLAAVDNAVCLGFLLA